MYQSINPETGDLYYAQEFDSKSTLKRKISLSDEAYLNWRDIPLKERIFLISSLSELMLRNQQELAMAASMEMGKPISEAMAEIEKCAKAIASLCEIAPKALCDRDIKSSYTESKIVYEAQGVILGIMPWNYPFWQVIRFIIPTLLAGNTVLLKHAPGVPKCAQLLSDLISTSGVPKNIFMLLWAKNKDVKGLIENQKVRGISFTGSREVGQLIGKWAGKEIKPCVLELGGSNALLVYPDADIHKAVLATIQSRFTNCGQSCIGAKRIIVHHSVAEEFTNLLALEIMKLKVGTPGDVLTQIGPLARIDLAKKVERQIKDSIKAGAKLLLGGTRSANFIAPTLLINVTPGMSCFDEEVFGPVACITVAASEDEMISLSNHPLFGLGVNIFSQDIEKIRTISHKFDEGAIFINTFVKSDPVLPFGGTKSSGLGRELSEEGFRAFTNIKTIVIDQSL